MPAFLWRGGYPPKQQIAAVLVVAFFALVFFVRNTIFDSSFSSWHTWTEPQTTTTPIRPPGECSPQAYANGHWEHHPRTTKTNMTSPDDAIAFSGFEKCASSRERYWHLAVNMEHQWDRFPKAHNYRWVPSQKCKGLKPLDAAALLKDLVEDGGWYFVGDSVTENHFFSLSCILGPHVIATPTYIANSGEFDRAWPQNLYLDPSSPVISSITFPKGFNIATTPLATFRRIDILFSKDELAKIHRNMPGQDKNLKDFGLFSDEGIWGVPLNDYIQEFLSPLPKGNYATMVVNTAGHWSETALAKVNPPGIKGILHLFEEATKQWADKLQAALWKDERGSGSFRLMNSRKKRRAVVRAYLPGHYDCFEHRKPWSEIQPFTDHWFNWNEIQDFNIIWDKLLSERKKYPDIHYLPIERPARLRPDAHTNDCLHIMTGAGVLEGFSHYIWHYVTQEIPA
ncbi:hypothetical protein B0H34DRAFT_802407 [Crassisporium funariophilum]|nr:hypothetical protein B0H34DRAFT_802407 [Crassisporium funariophilum]